MSEQLDVTDINHRDSYLIIDTREALEEYREACLRHGETPILNFNDEDEVAMFMTDLCSQLDFRVHAVNDHRRNRVVDRFLENSSEYLADHLTPLQRKLWSNVAKEVAHDFDRFGLYDKNGLHKYVFEGMVGDSMLMKAYNE